MAADPSMLRGIVAARHILSMVPKHFPLVYPFTVHLHKLYPWDTIHHNNGLFYKIFISILSLSHFFTITSRGYVYPMLGTAAINHTEQYLIGCPLFRQQSVASFSIVSPALLHILTLTVLHVVFC